MVGAVRPTQAPLCHRVDTPTSAQRVWLCLGCCAPIRVCSFTFTLPSGTDAPTSCTITLNDKDPTSSELIGSVTIPFTPEMSHRPRHVCNEGCSTFSARSSTCPALPPPYVFAVRCCLPPTMWWFVWSRLDCVPPFRQALLGAVEDRDGQARG